MRPQIIRSLAALSCVSVAAANEVVSLMLMNLDPQPLLGEVIGIDGPKTTYMINCAPDTPDDECGIPEGHPFTAGPDTFENEYRYNDFFISHSCHYSGTTWVSCVITHTASDLSTVVSTAGSVDLTFMPVTITSTATGVEATMAASSKSMSAEPSATADKGAPSATPTSASTSTPASSSSNAASEDGKAAETPNAAVPQATTGSTVQWLISGAGMALALAMA